MTSYGSIDAAPAPSVKEGGKGENESHETKPLIDAPSDKSPTSSKNLASSDQSLWSRLTFKWFTSLLHVGNKNNRLEQEDLDLIPLPDDCQTKEIIRVFDIYWKEELLKEKPSLVKALTRAFGFEYFIGALLKLIHDVNVFVGPQVLHGIIVFLRDPNAPLSQGLGLTLAITVSQLAMSLCLRHYFFKCYKTGLKIRTAVVLTVYRKALLLSAAERQSKSLGEITNLMSIDAQRLQGKCILFSIGYFPVAITDQNFCFFHFVFEELMNYMNSIWSSPLQICLSLYFLWRELGPSSLGGVAVILLMAPVTKKIAQIMGGLQKKLMKAKDKRIELNSEVLSGMKIIKIQAWEEAFSDRITALREAEVSQLLVSVHSSRYTAYVLCTKMY